MYKIKLEAKESDVLAAIIAVALSGFATFVLWAIFGPM